MCSRETYRLLKILPRNYWRKIGAWMETETSNLISLILTLKLLKTKFCIDKIFVKKISIIISSEKIWEKCYYWGRCRSHPSESRSNRCVLFETEGSCEWGRSLVETRDRDKKGSWSFFLTPRSPSVHPRTILSPGLLHSEELGVIQIRLIPVIFQSFIRRRRAAAEGGRGVGRERRSPRGWSMAPYFTLRSAKAS